jgi:hypothetical protein
MSYKSAYGAPDEDHTCVCKAWSPAIDLALLAHDPLRPALSRAFPTVLRLRRERSDKVGRRSAASAFRAGFSRAMRAWRRASTPQSTGYAPPLPCGQLQAKIIDRAPETSASTAERSARASEQQAAAITPQLETAQAAAEAARRQVDVAVNAAEEAKRIDGFSEAQMQASLRPVIALERRMGSQLMEDFVTDPGKGLALKLSANYGKGIQPNGFYIPNILSAGGELRIQVNWDRAKGDGMTFSYESQDDRKRLQIRADRPRIRPGARVRAPSRSPSEASRRNFRSLCSCMAGRLSLFSRLAS